ncbi:MAG TPA: hypothetical protein DCE78_08185 [Bacteroidetes bacterium]|nr:hypothetical protein [Bacteroidota bacterium]
MKSTPILTLIIALAVLGMSGCTGGGRLSEAGERNSRVEFERADGDDTGVQLRAAERGESKKVSIEGETILDLNGVTISEAQVEIIRDGFLQLSDVYVSPSGLIYAVDAMRHYLYRLDPVTGVIDSIGGRGQGETQFWGPVSVHATNDLKIFVQDAGNGRVQMFDRRFQFLGSLAMEGGSVMVSDSPAVGLVVNRAGGVVFWDEGESRVVGSTASYTIDNTFKPNLTQIQIPPTKLRESPDGFVLVGADRINIHRFSENGRYLGFLSGFGQILDVSVTENEWVILTSEYIISTSSTGQIIQVTRHTIENPNTINHDKSGLIVSTATKLIRVVI